MAEYRRGNRVEVSSKDEGFVGSYYEAVIVTKLIGNGNGNGNENENEYIVSYDTLMKEDLSGPLREVAAFDDIRPQPPVIRSNSFKSGDEIDAFDKDGWWKGIIAGRINRNHYRVHFDCSGEEITYPVDNLRIHQDFVKGEWIISKRR